MTHLSPLYILRHGETTWNVEGRLQGRFDSALTEKGRRQAAAQRQILAACDLTGFEAICSPQSRAVETAQIALAGTGLAPRSDPALSEIGLGEWAGRIRAEVMAQSGAADGFTLYELAPGGEGFAALHARCDAFLGRVTGPAILITHGMTSRMLRVVLTGQPVTALRDIGGGQGVVYRVEKGVQERLTL